MKFSQHQLPFHCILTSLILAHTHVIHFYTFNRMLKVKKSIDIVQNGCSDQAGCPEFSGTEMAAGAFVSSRSQEEPHFYYLHSASVA